MRWTRRADRGQSRRFRDLANSTPEAAVRKRCILVEDGRDTALDPNPQPGPEWVGGEAIRVLLLESSTEQELSAVLDRLGQNGPRIARHIHGDEWIQPLEQPGCAGVALPEPTVWMEGRTWFHLVFLPSVIVTVHRSESPRMDGFVQARWLDRPTPEATLQDVLMLFLEGLTMEETAEFARIRFEVERHASRLKESSDKAPIEHLEDLMTRSHHMATVYFEMQRLCETLEFSRAKIIELGQHRELFRLASQSLKRRREGVEQVQRRMEELQRQHLMDQQGRAEGRLRALTILSAVFLPLTLISGIYGMNFVNMPELEETHAYFIVLGGMAAVALGMVVFFVVKGWFR
jgi:magnesium transporter